MADREQGDVEGHVAEPVEEEDDPRQKRQVVVPGDHVLGAQVHVRADGETLVVGQEDLVLIGNAVRPQTGGEEQSRSGQ